MVTFKFNQPNHHLKHYIRHPHSREKLLNFVLNFLKICRYTWVAITAPYLSRKENKKFVCLALNSLCLCNTKVNRKFVSPVPANDVTSYFSLDSHTHLVLQLHFSYPRVLIN